jgi:homoserine dehydrogenase
MANDGAAFADALKAAQEAGFAEADPTLDITGGDAGHKLALIAGLAFGARVLPSAIPTEGIEQVDPRDIQYARHFGYVIRPLAVAERLETGALDLRVHPALVPEGDPLAHVDGALNAVAIQGEMVGPSFRRCARQNVAPSLRGRSEDSGDRRPVVPLLPPLFRAGRVWSACCAIRQAG